MDLWQREARLFKYGSGSGANFSALRGKGEPLSRGGVSSGLISFLRVGDRSAGAIKSGGTTRRSARMVIVDADHPDVEEFVAWKSNEDAKIRALHEAGFGDPSCFEDEATETVSGQNANNSVAVSDEFMRAVIDGDSWDLRARVDGSVAKTINAVDLWDSIAQAAWDCADPGLQFSGTINRWHTCKSDGPIRAANPCCLHGATLVHTEVGFVRIDNLVRKAALGEPLPRVWTWVDGAPSLGQCLRAWKAGDASELCVVRTKNGANVRCTPDHRFLTWDGESHYEYIEAQHLKGYRLANDDEVEWVTNVTHLTDETYEAVYDIEVEGVHNFMVTHNEGAPPVVVHNSEYVFLDDTACNLASINLAKFFRAGKPEERCFDWDAYSHAVRLWTIVLDISVSMAGYPTAEIARRSMLYRTLGLGYAALGELLVLKGLGYGTKEGRDFAAELTSLMTAVAYHTSTELAQKLGTFPRYEANRQDVLDVLDAHAQAAPTNLRTLWNTVVCRALTTGVRNAQVSLLAPTGTIGIVMDCATTGVEPFYSDTIFKKLAGGGYMKLVSRHFNDTLRAHGFDPSEYTRSAWTVEDGRVCEYTWVEPPAALQDVLVCADDLTPEQHVDMMAAVQPSLSGAISKTVNMPASATVEEIKALYLRAWDKGLKSIAIYRDGCKPTQPLQGRKPKEGVRIYGSRIEAEQALNVPEARAKLDEFVGAVAGSVEDETRRLRGDSRHAPARGERIDPPDEIASRRIKLELSGHTFYLHLGEYEDGSLAEVFVVSPRTGSSISGWVNAWAKTFSLALQHGTPLEVLVDAMRGLNFEPAGYHNGRPVSSAVDAFARVIEQRYLVNNVDLEITSVEPPDHEFSISSDGVTTSYEVRKSTLKPTGQTCTSCGSARLRRSGSCFVCETCGETTGCS